MAAKNEDTARGKQPDDLAVSAAEGMLGPNPFVGLRPRDILATAQQIGAGGAATHVAPGAGGCAGARSDGCAWRQRGLYAASGSE
jgi:hypothetical protein